MFDFQPENMHDISQVKSCCSGNRTSIQVDSAAVLQAVRSTEREKSFATCSEHRQFVGALSVVSVTLTIPCWFNQFNPVSLVIETEMPGGRGDGAAYR